MLTGLAEYSVDLRINYSARKLARTSQVKKKTRTERPSHCKLVLAGCSAIKFVCFTEQSFLEKVARQA